MSEYSLILNSYFHIFLLLFDLDPIIYTLSFSKTARGMLPLRTVSSQPEQFSHLEVSLNSDVDSEYPVISISDYRA